MHAGYRSLELVGTGSIRKYWLDEKWHRYPGRESGFHLLDGLERSKRFD